MQCTHLQRRAAQLGLDCLTPSAGHAFACAAPAHLMCTHYQTPCACVYNVCVCVFAAMVTKIACMRKLQGHRNMVVLHEVFIEPEVR